MKYKCLVLDHDDTVVDSSRSIHYPAFLDTLKQLRPNLNPLSFDEFNHHCFVYGFHHLCEVRYGFDKHEMMREYEIWKNHTQSKQAPAFDGWKALLHQFKAQGGIIIVVSYSESKEILRDYQDHFNLIPDRIYGYDAGPENIKPHIKPIVDVLKDFKLKHEEICVIDDMPVGLAMAENAKVDFIWAKWAHTDERLLEHIKKTSQHACSDVQELYRYLDF